MFSVICVAILGHKIVCYVWIIFSIVQYRQLYVNIVYNDAVTSNYEHVLLQ